MTLSVVDSAEWTESVADTSWTITKPSGVADGDLLVAVLAGNNDVVATGPTGWTEIQKGDIGAPGIDRTLWVGYRYVTDAGSEPSSWTDGSLDANITDKLSLCACLRGVSAVIVDGGLSTISSGDPPAVVTTDTGMYAITAAMQLTQDPDDAALTPPAGYTEIVEGENNGAVSATNAFVTAALAYKLVPAAETEDPGAWTSTITGEPADSSWCAGTFAVGQPSAPPAGGSSLRSRGRLSTRS